MSSFDSPIGSKKFPPSQMREFDIPDESESSEEPVSPTKFKISTNEPQNLAEIEREIRAAKEARRTGRERLNDGARHRLEILLGMIRTTRSVDIGGNVYVFQTLKAKEMREAIVAASEYDGTIQGMFEVRKQFLARSLVSIAGVDIEQFIGSNSLEARLLFIEELDDVFLNRLYNEYLELSKEAQNKFAITTQEDVKQVTEDLKK